MRPGPLQRSILLLSASLVWAQALAAVEPSLMRIERREPTDRNMLLAAGVSLVAELEECFLAFGDPAAIASSASRLTLGSETLDRSAEPVDYALVGLRRPVDEIALAVCGELVWQEASWAIVKSPRFEEPACSASRNWMLQRLPRTALEPTRPPPEAYRRLQMGVPAVLETDPLVQQMVDSVTPGLAVGMWDTVIGAASTRFSRSPGCFEAADLVYSQFLAMGLQTEYHVYDALYAPSVIATIPGRLNPDQIHIVIGHLDDMPPTGLAPGADDNASGAAMVLTLAEVMSQYAFAGTVVFIAVTGEEQGLVGSRAYADEASARGDDIVAVLNGDMIGWQGNGLPALEDLDLNLNAASTWLGNLFIQAANDYGTGCPINAFQCPSMVYSDHAAFWSKGWSAVCGITDNEGFCGQVGSYPYYHTSSDTRANCGDPAFYVSAIKAYLATFAHLADPLCRHPLPPSSIWAQADGDNRIALNWSEVPDGSTYEIYRSPGGCSAGSGFYQVGESSSLSFVDTTASGNLLYGYRIHTRDATGYCRSGPSLCVEASTTGDCLEPPQFAGLESVTNDEQSACSLSLGWSPADPLFCGTGVRYNVYRSTLPDFLPGAANRVASCLTELIYTDLEVGGGNTYFYVVRAEDDTTGHAGPCGGNEDFNTVRRSAEPTGPITRLLEEDFETGLGDWQEQTPWALVSTTAHGGIYSAFGGNVSNTCATLTSADTFDLPVEPPAWLSFWTDYAIETTYDGVQIQISTDGGASWQLLIPAGGYPGSASASCSAKIGSAVFNGVTQDWTSKTVDLSAYAGQSVRIRFVMASDVSINQGGFFLDDIELAFVEACTSGSGLIFADGFESGDTSGWSVTLP